MHLVLKKCRPLRISFIVVSNKVKVLLFTLLLTSFACIATPAFYSPPSSAYSSTILNNWMTMQIRIMSTTIASYNGPFVRIYSYCGLVAYESIHPGILTTSKNNFPLAALNNFPSIPSIEKNKKYHWPSSLNAALAFMNKAMFSNTSPANKAAIDSLEMTLKKMFIKTLDSATIERSSDFGKMVAKKIFEWAETDGYKKAGNPYMPPSGPGKWIPTPPAYAKASTPYWGNLRTMVTGSIENTQPPPPPPYSEEPGSDFYKMIQQVYNVDQAMTAEQKNITVFWRDINPGVTAPGHWLNILLQVFQKEKTPLDKAAFTYAFTGMALNDAWISCWKTRYEYNLLRPVTFIRNVMGHSEWLPFLSTPPHPEYTSGFAAMAGAVCEALTIVFGNNYRLVDHTYDDVGFKPRSFNSFNAMAREAGDSKFYGGIHYKLSVDAGLKQGQAVSQNIKTLLVIKSR